MSAPLLWLGVGLLSGLGAVARYALTRALATGVAARFPVGTLSVNLSGAMLLGLLVGLRLHQAAFLLAGTALLGSYTTFSTWMAESLSLAEQGRRRGLAGSLLLSLALGVAAVAAGRMIAGG